MLSEVYYHEFARNQTRVDGIGDGAIDLERDYITLHIADLHMEYVLSDNPPKAIDGGTARVFTLIDYFRLEMLMGEDATETFLSHLPEKLKETFGDCHINVWHLWGTYNQLRWVFDDFCGKIFAPAFESEGMTFITPGGDDDVYDYWPTAVTVAWQLASDLDEAHPSGSVCETLKIRYAAHIEKYGEVDEFTPPWEEE